MALLLTPNALPSTTLSPTLTLLDGINLQGFQPQLCPEFTEDNRYKCYELSKKWGHQMHFCTNREKTGGDWVVRRVSNLGPDPAVGGVLASRSDRRPGLPPSQGKATLSWASESSS